VEKEGIEQIYDSTLSPSDIGLKVEKDLNECSKKKALKANCCDDSGKTSNSLLANT